MKNKPDCAGPECERPALYGRLCASHYRQVYRGQALKPLRNRLDTKGRPAVQIAARLELNHANALAQAASAKGMALYQYAQAVLVAHARRLLRGAA